MLLYMARRASWSGGCVQNVFLDLTPVQSTLGGPTRALLRAHGGGGDTEHLRSGWEGGWGGVAGLPRWWFQKGGGVLLGAPRMYLLHPTPQISGIQFHSRTAIDEASQL